MTLANFSAKTPAIYRLLLLTVAGATFIGGCSQLPRASSSPQESIAPPPTSTPTPSNLGNTTSRSLPVRDDTDSDILLHQPFRYGVGFSQPDEGYARFP
ncbi:hypothetical protein, partial [Argonema galeatum]|uniref:hypothetical protein n=1 Tax=Argonema galeatum TaxID=2942762 RepID=UPI002011F909